MTDKYGAWRNFARSRGLADCRNRIVVLALKARILRRSDEHALG